MEGVPLGECGKFGDALEVGLNVEGEDPNGVQPQIGDLRCDGLPEAPEPR